MEVLGAPGRRGALEVRVGHVEHLARPGRPARSPRATSRTTACCGRLAVVDPAAGQRPAAGVGPARRVADQQHLVAADARRAYAATRWSWNGAVLVQHLGDQADRRHRAVEHLRRAASRRPPWSSRRPRPRAARGCRPAPSRRRRSAARARRRAGPAARCCAGGRSRRARSRRSATSSPVSSCTSRTTASRGSSPCSSPPPGSVHSSLLVSRVASRLSRIWSSRMITAYAATRCTFRTCRPGRPDLCATPSTLGPGPGPHVGADGRPGHPVERGTTRRRSSACPPRCAGYHGAYSPGRGRCSGSRWSSSSPSCSRLPELAGRRRRGPRPARPCIGSWNRTSTSRPRVRSGFGNGASRARFCAHSRWLPHTVTGTSGAPVSRASGDRAGHQRAHDVRRRDAALGEDADRLALAAAASAPAGTPPPGAARSTGMCRIASMPRPTGLPGSGASQMSARHMNRTSRRPEQRLPDEHEVGERDVVARPAPPARRRARAPGPRTRTVRSRARSSARPLRMTRAVDPVAVGRHVPGSERLRRTAGGRRGRSSAGRPSARPGRRGRGPRR